MDICQYNSFFAMGGLGSRIYDSMIVLAGGGVGQNMTVDDNSGGGVLLKNPKSL